MKFPLSSKYFNRLLNENGWAESFILITILFSTKWIKFTETAPSTITAIFHVQDYTSKH